MIYTAVRPPIQEEHIYDEPHHRGFECSSPSPECRDLKYYNFEAITGHSQWTRHGSGTSAVLLAPLSTSKT